jgi:hypothetical protein
MSSEIVFDGNGSLSRIDDTNAVKKVKIVDGAKIMKLSSDAGGRNVKLSERGFMSFFENPFKTSVYDKKELNKMWDDWLELPFFGTSMVMCISQVLTRFKEIEKVVWNNSAEMEVVNERYGGDQR